MTKSPESPIQFLIDGANLYGASRQNMPLKHTRYLVTFSAGLIIVVARRRFLNTEARSIEAVLTFPVPVSAVVFDLSATIEGRRLIASARPREIARDRYEAAVERGKTTVLHEELTPGVHMLSVGQIGPGQEVEVETRFVMAASWFGGRANVRIPLTVGDVYGSSRLYDVEDLSHVPSEAKAEVTVRGNQPGFMLDGKPEMCGTFDLPLSRPIDLSFAAWQPKDLVGYSALGQEVRLRFAPAAAGQRLIDVALVVDISELMGESFSTRDLDVLKAEAVRSALQRVVNQFAADDQLDFWRFENAPQCMGQVTIARTPNSKTEYNSLISRTFVSPKGGTEIGKALDVVTATTSARDILVVTDGKSHALDIHALLLRGKRFSVLLIGEDVLEANLARLVTLSGGEIFVASAHNLDAALIEALRSLRRHSGEPRAVSPTAGCNLLGTTRAAMNIDVNWEDCGGIVVRSAEQHAIAAYSASLLLSTLTQSDAMDLALSENLVTHLTSLVLIDEAGATQDDVATTRRVPLATPATDVTVHPGSGDGRGGARRLVAKLNQHDSLISKSALSSVRSSYIELFSSDSKKKDAIATALKYVLQRLMPAKMTSHGYKLLSASSKDGLNIICENKKIYGYADFDTQIRKTAFFGTQYRSLHFRRAFVSDQCQRLALQLPWITASEALATGAIDQLSAKASQEIRSLEKLIEVQQFAKHLDMTPRNFIISLIAIQAPKRVTEARVVLESLIKGRPKRVKDGLLSWVAERGSNVPRRVPRQTAVERTPAPKVEMLVGMRVISFRKRNNQPSLRL